CPVASDASGSRLRALAWARRLASVTPPATMARATVTTTMTRIADTWLPATRSGQAQPLNNQSDLRSRLGAHAAALLTESNRLSVPSADGDGCLDAPSGSRNPADDHERD